MNPNGVEIVRVYTREFGGTIADTTPHVTAPTFHFQVVVEAEAGSVKQGDGSPYRFAIEAFDLTTGNKPPGAFSKVANGYFTGGPPPAGWPAHSEVFTITLTAAEATAVEDHILRYVASLVTPPPGPGVTPQIVSFAESPLFIVVAAL